MPVRPENRHLYPDNWETEVVPRIRERSGNRCEVCGVDNHTYVVRNDDGEAYFVGMDKSCLDDEPDAIRIVCTTAHLDHNPMNCEDDNLAFLCQKCHNSFDAQDRADNRAMNRKKAMEDAGQLSLLTEKGKE